MVGGLRATKVENAWNWMGVSRNARGTDVNQNRDAGRGGRLGKYE